MKRILTIGILVAGFSLYAAAPPRGSDRLRELVVFPEMNFSFYIGINIEGNHWAIWENEDIPDKILQLQGELKQKPDDIKLLLRLGSVLDSDNRTNESAAYYQKAEQLCQKRLAANPQDGLTMMDRGEALHGLDKDDEAERSYRQATLTASNDWRCWAGLGNFLAGQFVTMLPKDMRQQLFNPQEEPTQAFLEYRPTPEVLKNSETRFNEVAGCFDRAMALAPKEPELFLQHAGYAFYSGLHDLLIRHFRDNEKLDSKAWSAAFFSTKMVADLRKAAELNPNDYQVVCMAAYAEWANAVASYKGPNKPSQDDLPGATREHLHDAISRLESIAANSDKATAAGALENHGFLLSITSGNFSEAMADSRRAIALDPTREGAWDMLLGTLAQSSGSYEEISAVCEARLKQKDSVRNHLLLAHAFHHLKKWDKAEEQTEAALKLDPNNTITHLELVALALKQGVGTNFLEKAGQHLARIQELYDKSPEIKDNVSHWRCLNYCLAIYNALINTPECKELAKERLEAVLKQFPDDQQAKDISNALN